MNIRVSSVDARLPARRRLQADRRPAPGDRRAGRRPGPRPAPPDAAGCHRHRQDLHASPPSSSGTRSRRSCWPTTRPWRPSSTPSSASSSRTTRSSTSSATSTTTSPRPTCRGTDTYIEKDSSRNEEIDKLRHAATQRAVRAARRDHRGQRQLHLRPGRAGRLRGDDPPAASEAASTAATRSCAISSICSTSATTRPSSACALPRPRRHAGDHAGLGRPARPGRVLRRRGRADHRDRPADRRAAGRARTTSTSTRPPTS